jgi:hypothetical protein
MRKAKKQKRVRINESLNEILIIPSNDHAGGGSDLDNGNVR